MGSPESQCVVLLADDEPQIRSFIIAVLERNRMTVLAAANGERALALSREHPERIDLLVSDIQMGNGLNGIELAQLIRRERPGIAVLVMSGTPDCALLASASGLSFLAKPFTMASLLERVRQSLAGESAERSGTCTEQSPQPDGGAAHSPDVGPEERRQLEARLLGDMRSAAQGYRDASAQVQSLIEHSREIGWDHPDGAHAMRKAATVEKVALDKYSRALNDFYEAIVRGRKPS